MHYAILAYHAEGVVESWSEEEDKALMDELLATHERMVAAKHFGPAARLGATEDAKTLRGLGDLAARTMVPASSSSRADAGAGTDND